MNADKDKWTAAQITVARACNRARFEKKNEEIIESPVSNLTYFFDGID